MPVRRIVGNSAREEGVALVKVIRESVLACGLPQCLVCKHSGLYRTKRRTGRGSRRVSCILVIQLSSENGAPACMCRRRADATSDAVAGVVSTVPRGGVVGPWP